MLLETKYNLIKVIYLDPCPFIDCAPSHPDPVLTTLVHLEKSLKMCFAMKYAQHCTPLNLKLYVMTSLIQWSDGAAVDHEVRSAAMESEVRSPAPPFLEPHTEL